MVDVALADAVIVGAEDKADNNGLDILRCGPAKIFLHRIASHNIV